MVPSDCTIFDNQKNCCLFKIQTSSTVVEEGLENAFKWVEKRPLKTARDGLGTPTPFPIEKAGKQFRVARLLKAFQHIFAPSVVQYIKKDCSCFTSTRASKHRATDEITSFTRATV